MPHSDRSPEQIIEYEACVGCLQATVDRHLGCQFLVGVTSTCPRIHSVSVMFFMRQFAESNSMLWLDELDGECGYTYHNDVNKHYKPA